MTIIHDVAALCGLLLILWCAWLLRENRHIKNRLKPTIGLLLIIQYVCAFFLLKNGIGQGIIQKISAAFNSLLNYSMEGIKFVFGDLANYVDPQNSSGNAPFFMVVLLPIILMSGIIGILQWLRILPWVIKGLGRFFHIITGTNQLQSFSSIAAILIGQEQLFIALKKVVPRLHRERLLLIGISGMSSASITITGSYMSLIPSKYVIAALILNTLGSFIIGQIICPVDTGEPINIEELTYGEAGNKTQRIGFFPNLIEYFFHGATTALLVAVMLIGFISLLAVGNGIVHSICGYTLQQLLGYVFAPVAFLEGVDWHNAVNAGNFIATKLISNEFVAMQQLQTLQSNPATQLSHHDVAIISTFLVSFANLGAIGILSGTAQAIDKEKGLLVAKLGPKILVCSNLVSALSALIVGTIIS